MKWDVVVGNPPFGADKKGSSRFLHYRIMKNSLSKCREFLCFIMPSKPITVKIEDEWLSMFKSAVCTKIEVVVKEMFSEAQMDKTAIFFCDRKARKDQYDKKLDVDDRIYTMIDDEGHRLFIDKMCKIEQLKIDIQTGHKSKKDDYDYLVRDVKKDSWYLNVNGAYGSMGGVWMSGYLKTIPVMIGEQIIKFYGKDMVSRTILYCPSYEYGMNLKKLFCESLVFRYGLWLTQTRQCIRKPQFKYIPSLDYSKIDNDLDLLLACGFTGEEADTVLTYLSTFDFTRNRNDMVRDYDG
jgi:hypothetical protein